MEERHQRMNPAGFDFKSRYILIGGHRFHYIREGQGPTLVLLHGNPTWSYLWRHLVRSLRDRYEVIVLDHLGCGGSEKPVRYRYVLENHIRNAESFIRALGLNNITLGMHDWGGAIGMGVAVKNPKLFRRFLVFNTAAFPSQQMPLALRFCRTPFLGRFLIQRMNIFARGAGYLATAKGLSPETRKLYLKPYDSYSNRVATYQFVCDIPMSQSHSSWETLCEIEKGLEQFHHTPMAIYWGGRDWVFTRDFFDEWKRRFPHAEAYYFQHSGHLVLEDSKDEIEPLLKNFLVRTSHAIQY